MNGETTARTRSFVSRSSNDSVCTPMLRLSVPSAYTSRPASVAFSSLWELSGFQRELLRAETTTASRAGRGGTRTNPAQKRKTRKRINAFGVSCASPPRSRRTGSRSSPDIDRDWPGHCRAEPVRDLLANLNCRNKIERTPVYRWEAQGALSPLSMTLASGRSGTAAG
jgi:hypothetical protein